MDFIAANDYNAAMITASALPPLSLYVHVPWCVKKCPYCDFNSHRQPDTLPAQAYIDRLISELTHYRHLLQARPLHSIFIGGGTPSLLQGSHYAQLLSAIADLNPLQPELEITLEANPATVEHDHFSAYLDAGINRLSLGIQSFNPAHLTALGRIHTREDGLNSATAARRAGFNAINLDLMFGLPHQSTQAGLDDLALALSLQPGHLSWYQLTLEPNTLFHHRPPPLPSDDTIAHCFEQGQALLAQHGYHPYEVSAYAKPAQQCRHNLNYWQFGDYLGIGAGAHSKLTSEDNQIHRHWNAKHPTHYLDPERPRVSGTQTLTAAERVFEFFLNRWRYFHPISAAELKRGTGLDFAALATPLADLQQQGLITLDSDSTALTPLGKRFLNEVTAAFLPENEQ